jgi:hypothetical protein
MEGALKALNTDLGEYMDAPQTSSAFLQGPERYAEFTALTGLNDAAFLSTEVAPKPAAVYVAGGIEIEEALANVVSLAGHLEPPRLPDYAMITGNTEQRYLRVLFLRDYRSLFRIIIKNSTTQFSGGGIGIINQILSALPSDINLIRTSTRITERANTLNRGWTEIIGHWDTSAADPPSKSDYMKTELTRIFRGLDLVDLEGNVHTNALEIVNFANPETLYSRVFVSYSTRSDPAKLTYLLNMLWDNHFRPVIGTDLNRSIRKHAGRPPTSVDVVEAAFEAIPGCVALVSLQLPHPDFRITDQRGHPGYVVPPWAVAEEVYAWSLGLGRVIRIRHLDVEEPRYNYHLPTFRFSSDDEFLRAVDSTIAELNAFRAAHEFGEFRDEARRSQYVPWYPPGDV